MSENRKPEQGVKLRGAEKVARIPVKVIPTVETPRKPDWIRVKMAAPEEVQRIKTTLREQKLHTVCEEAACPNLPECFGGGTATFMIMGDICTRRCPFCDVAHGRPNALDADEPRHMAETIANLGLKYAVITSVDRDDLLDGGAQHFVDCIKEARALSPKTLLEILVPDFRGRMDIALRIMTECPPDVFNHNIETVPRLYKAMRPGSDYQHSLNLLKMFKEYCPDIPTKCGLMVGIGETEEEVLALLDDLHACVRCPGPEGCPRFHRHPYPRRCGRGRERRHCGRSGEDLLLHGHQGHHFLAVLRPHRHPGADRVVHRAGEAARQAGAEGRRPAGHPSGRSLPVSRLQGRYA